MELVRLKSVDWDDRFRVQSLHELDQVGDVTCPLAWARTEVATTSSDLLLELDPVGIPQIASPVTVKDSYVAWKLSAEIQGRHRRPERHQVFRGAGQDLIQFDSIRFEKPSIVSDVSTAEGDIVSRPGSLSRGSAEGYLASRSRSSGGRRPRIYRPRRAGRSAVPPGTDVTSRSTSSGEKAARTRPGAERVELDDFFFQLELADPCSVRCRDECPPMRARLFASERSVSTSVRVIPGFRPCVRKVTGIEKRSYLLLREGSQAPEGA